jgi:hypothetical protein
VLPARLLQTALSAFSPPQRTRAVDLVQTAHVTMCAYPREAWTALGDMDEQFRGWGGEDNAWGMVLDYFWGGRLLMQEAVSYHLWHPVRTGKRGWRRPDPRFVAWKGATCERGLDRPDLLVP